MRMEDDVQREHLGWQPGVGPQSASGTASANHGVDTLDPLALLASLSRPWRVADQLPLPVLNGIPDCTPLQVQLLHNRGINGIDGMREWMERDWRASERLPGIDEAVTRIQRAIAQRERIVVFG